MRIALAQLSPVLNDKMKNLEIMKKAVSSCEADLIVFGELFLTGYMCRDNLPRLAESLEGHSVKSLARIAEENDTHIIFGMPEQSSRNRGLIYNSAVLVCPDERVESYRKMHLANFGPFEEKLYFAVGDHLPVFETGLGRLGLLICFDVFFPELSKIYALKGADILVHISASPSATRPFFEKVMLARAIENTVFYTFTNLVGTELNVVFWGGNAVIGPRGDPLARGVNFKEEILECEIDLADLRIAREYRPTIRDTRMELFCEVERLLGRNADSKNQYQHNTG
jgi:predicted amidohydrolase